MKVATELLRKRELRALRLQTVLRGVAIALIWILAMTVAGTAFERVATTTASVLYAAFVASSALWLRRGEKLRLVGYGGAILDVALLAALPFIWYRSAAVGVDLPLGYMAKTVVSITAISLIVVNGLALRPAYPLIVGAGAAAVLLTILGLALTDDRTTFTMSFAEATMGPPVHSGLFATKLVVVVAMAVVVSLLAASARNALLEATALEKTNTQLGRYFSPNVVSAIAADEFVQRGGRLQKIAVLFADIRGFTALSEAAPPEQVVRLLSTYHDRMVRQIFRHGGTLDKFLGDGIMATFGTPEPAHDDAQRAVQAGIAMEHALQELNRERQAAGDAPLAHGIGIHFGPAIVGNIGTEDRLEFTAIGDTVNTASRIESSCKTYDATLVISEAVKQRIDSSTPLRQLDDLQAKGRAEALSVFAVDVVGTGHRSPPSDRSR